MIGTSKGKFDATHKMTFTNSFLIMVRNQNIFQILNLILTGVFVQSWDKFVICFSGISSYWNTSLWKGDLSSGWLWMSWPLLLRKGGSPTTTYETPKWKLNHIFLTNVFDGNHLIQTIRYLRFSLHKISETIQKFKFIFSYT